MLLFILKGTVSPDILILFMMSLIKSVLFVWALIVPHSQSGAVPMSSLSGVE